MIESSRPRAIPPPAFALPFPPPPCFMCCINSPCHSDAAMYRVVSGGFMCLSVCLCWSCLQLLVSVIYTRCLIYISRRTILMSYLIYLILA